LVWWGGRRKRSRGGAHEPTPPMRPSDDRLIGGVPGRIQFTYIPILVTTTNNRESMASYLTTIIFLVT
jgi:hypothetical protein